MNAIEQARHKYFKNLERRQRNAAPQGKADEQLPVEETVPVVAAPVLNEKSPDGFITVTVELPDRQFSFVLRKRNVLSNVQKVYMNRDAIKRAVRNGLEPLLGGMDELP